MGISGTGGGETAMAEVRLGIGGGAAVDVRLLGFSGLVGAGAGAGTTGVGTFVAVQSDLISVLVLL